ncbi:hypothetical protein CEP51_016011 [Fusarium floridanum]|uniref:Uncharacterized protein n=1 Tax=Fusarium floridanum TaxID=1325733 RepID=A0A428NYY5_9HYPO|nr:hypothetical protein CEP51_016011 [Fusarium floridanum]
MPRSRKTAAGAKRRHEDDDTESRRPRKTPRNDDTTQSQTDDSGDIPSSEPDEPQSVAGEPAEGNVGNLDRMRSYLEETRKAVREADLDTIVGPVEPTFTANWTQQDEDTMLAEWDASPEKEAYASLRENFALKSL